MKRGFSLIEIIVVTVIILLITGGVMVTTGAYKTRQEQVATMGEVRSYVELARNYAKTMQWPPGVDTNQKYTKVEIINNEMIITAIPEISGGITAEFTRKKFSDNGGLDVTINPSSFCFTAYDAKVVNCGTGATGVSAEISIGTEGYKVLINENGQISQSSP